MLDGFIESIINLAVEKISPELRTAVERFYKKLVKLAESSKNKYDDALVKALGKILDIE